MISLNNFNKGLRATILGIALLTASFSIFSEDDQLSVNGYAGYSPYLRGRGPPVLIEYNSVYAAITTAYNPVPEQTDSTPHITASGYKVREGIVANNCFPFGTIIEIDGTTYIIQDRMNKRYGCGRIDILMFDKDEAIKYGKQIKSVKVVK